MAEENNEVILREGLVQFVGALLGHSSFGGKAGRQVVAAALSEEAVKLSMENDSPDMYVAKPVLRAAAFILKSRAKEMLKAEKETSGRCSSLLVKQAECYIRAVNILEGITDKTPEGGS